MPRWFLRTGTEILGWLLVVVGLVLLVLPGPGTLLILAGVALLAPHYAWAHRAMNHLHDAALEAAHKSVQTKRGIAWAALSACSIILAGLVWLFEPRIPVFTVWIWHIGPGLPGGRAAGIGLMASGLAALTVLCYSIVRWYPTASSQDL